MGNLIYDLKIDWDGNGHVDATNEAVNLVRYAVDRGRDTIIEPSGGGFTPQQIGMLYLTLDNSSGRYDPWNTDSAIYGDIAPGKLIEFKVSDNPQSSIIVAGGGYTAANQTYFYAGEFGGKAYYNGTLMRIGWSILNAAWEIQRTQNGSMKYYSEDDVATPDLCTTWVGDPLDDPVPTVTAQPVWPIFTGYVSDIQLIGKNDQVTIVAEDGWGYLSDRVVSTFGSMWEDTLNGLYYVIETVSQYPQGVSGSTDDTFGVPRYFFFLKDNCMRAVSELSDAGLGRIACKADGEFIFKALSSTDNIALTVTEDIILDNISPTLPWQFKRDIINLLGYQSTTYEVTANVYESTGSILVPSSDTFELYGHYTYDGERVDVVGGLGYGYLSSTGFESTDITIYGSFNNRNPILFENAGPTDAYLKNFYAIGIPYLYTEADYSYGESTSSQSAFTFASRIFEINRNMTTNSVLYDTAQTAADIERIDDIGATLLNYLSVPRPNFSLQMQGRYSNQFSLDIEDTVQLTLDTLGIDDTYRIHKISHRSGMTCQDVTSTFKLYPIMTKST